MEKPIFYDPGQKRWKRLRRVIDFTALFVTAVVAAFAISVYRRVDFPDLFFPAQHRPYHALKERDLSRKSTVARGSRRKTKSKPSQVVLNSEEGIRGAFYVTWDAGSYSSLKQYMPQIDLLFPEWLHVLSSDGQLRGFNENNQSFNVVDSGKVVSVDDQQPRHIMPLITLSKSDIEVFPLVNNFDSAQGIWRPDVAGPFLNNAAGRENFRQQIDLFLASNAKFRGLCLDLEEIPTKSQAGYKALVESLYGDFHPRGLALYVSVPADDDDFDYKFLAAHSDGLIVMNYDQYQPDSPPGPIASQDWFVENLRKMLTKIPREKLICAIGNYGYEWSHKPHSCPSGGEGKVCTVSVQEAWLAASDSESELNFDPGSLNPHFAYQDDGDKSRHEVWFLDAATARNQMIAAKDLFGIQTFALWRLGSEDRSLWTVWDAPRKTPADQLNRVPPGQDIDLEGDGEILRIQRRPQDGARTVHVDLASSMITSENFERYPSPYVLEQVGKQKKKVAISFDDGPDPEFTPKILDVLKAKQAPAIFMIIGEQGERFPSILTRIYKEGHEVGNHTFTHPDISEISDRHLQLELNLTERLFEAKLGVKPVFFRPPYSIDQEPDTAEEVRPLEATQDLGYVTVGDKIDPNDWRTLPRHSAAQIAADTFAQLGRGNVILLHDGGGNRTETVKALPLIIDGLRSRGYRIVPVSDLIGKTRAEIMPPLGRGEWASAFVDNLAFSGIQLLQALVVFVFFIGDVLMSARLVFVGALAIFDRLRERLRPSAQGVFQPPVAVLIPAYNEEKVIERTVRSVLSSDYPRVRVIVIDDGSTDRTYEIVEKAFQSEVAAGKVILLHKPNGGKAAALNFGLNHVTEEIYVGIDADTVIAQDAVSRLIPHFSSPNIAAVAGNAKVGNRVNLWTRWQALEYITSQNFERRALDVFGAVSVVPGALGAWRTDMVREAGGYHLNTVAEDADLTMSLLRIGKRVIYEDRALAYTEAPKNANGLMRQRFRWSFGILQAVWKHRDAFFRNGSLGWVALPNITVFQILLPLVSPFIDIMFLTGVVSYLLDRHFHHEAANTANFEKLLIYFFGFLLIDFTASVIAFSLERRSSQSQGDWWLLPHILLQRFAYRQLFSVVLFKTIKRAFDGRPFSWDKLERTAALSGKLDLTPSR